LPCHERSVLNWHLSDRLCGLVRASYRWCGSLRNRSVGTKLRVGSTQVPKAAPIWQVPDRLCGLVRASHPWRGSLRSRSVGTKLRVGNTQVPQSCTNLARTRPAMRSGACFPPMARLSAESLGGNQAMGRKHAGAQSYTNLARTRPALRSGACFLPMVWLSAESLGGNQATGRKHAGAQSCTYVP
jgi:hypothetical protein